MEYSLHHPSSAVNSTLISATHLWRSTMPAHHAYSPRHITLADHCSTCPVQDRNDVIQLCSRYMSCVLSWHLLPSGICRRVGQAPFLRLGDLVKHRINTMTYGPRSFLISASNIWIKLPTHLLAGDLSRDQFAGLKTHLFAHAYSPEVILWTILFKYRR